MRAVPGDAKAASHHHRRAEDHRRQPRRLGRGYAGAVVARSSKAKTQVLAVNGADLTLKNADGFNPGDVVELFDGKHHRPRHRQERAGSRWSPWTPPAPWTWPTPRWAPPKYIKHLRDHPHRPPGARRWKPMRTSPSRPDALNNAAGQDRQVRPHPAGDAAGPQGSGRPRQGRGQGQARRFPPRQHLPKRASTPYRPVRRRRRRPGAGTAPGRQRRRRARPPAPDAYPGPGRRPRHAAPACRLSWRTARVSIMAIPGVTAPEVQAALIALLREHARAALPFWTCPWS